jgi:hypothetical protein
MKNVEDGVVAGTPNWSMYDGLCLLKDVARDTDLD